MTAADVPGVIDSRAFFTTDSVATRVTPKAGDTTTVPVNVDSSGCGSSSARRPKNTTNLQLRLYGCPSPPTRHRDFASLDPDFTAPPVATLNVTDLLAQPAITDTQVVRRWEQHLGHSVD